MRQKIAKVNINEADNFIESSDTLEKINSLKQKLINNEDLNLENYDTIESSFYPINILFD